MRLWVRKSRLNIRYRGVSVCHQYTALRSGPVDLLVCRHQRTALPLCAAWLIFGFGVTRQSFPAALTPKAAFADPAKACRGIHHIGSVYPDDPCDQFGCDIKREVDVF